MQKKNVTLLYLAAVTLLSSSSTADYLPSRMNPCDDNQCTNHLQSDALPLYNVHADHYGIQAFHMMVGSRFPLKPYDDTIPKLGGHGAAVPGDWTGKNWRLSPVYDSDVQADPFPQGTGGDFGVDPYDCNPANAAWEDAKPNEFDTLFVQGIYEITCGKMTDKPATRKKASPTERFTWWERITPDWQVLKLE